MKPLVSVVVPVYNLEKYIDRCLDSLLCQSLNNIEILIIDDGSTDLTADKVRIKIKQKDNIKLIESENKGPGGARNIGLKEAKGKYLAFVDGDDWIDRNMLKEMYMIAERKSADIVVCDYYLNYGIRKEKVIVNMEAERIYQIKENKKLIFELGYLTNKLWKKELFNDEEFIEKITYEDLEMIPKIISKAETVIKINKAYYNYFMREDSITKSNIKLKDKYIGLLSLEKKLINLKKYNEFKEEFNFLFFLAIYVEAFNKILQGKGLLKDLLDINSKISFKLKKEMLINKYMIGKYKFYLIFIIINCKIFYQIIFVLKNIKSKYKEYIKKIYYIKYKKKLEGNLKNVGIGVRLKLNGKIILDKDASIYSTAIINLEKNSKIEMGKNSSIGGKTSIYLRENAILKLKENSFFNEQCLVSGGDIEIGKNVLIAPRCNFIAVTHKYDYNLIEINKQEEEEGKIIIKDNVWIGINSTILNNVIIEEGAIIAAGSVVNKNVGKNEIWGGVPAKFIKNR